jgi:hypothetical protein
MTVPCRYDLYATVNHHGSIDGGHYVAHMQVLHSSPATHVTRRHRAVLSPVCCRWATHGIAGTTAACRRRAALPWTHPLIFCFTAAPQRLRDIRLLCLFRSQLPSRAGPSAMRRGAMCRVRVELVQLHRRPAVRDTILVLPPSTWSIAAQESARTRNYVAEALQTGCRQHASARALRLRVCWAACHSICLPSLAGWSCDFQKARARSFCIPIAQLLQCCNRNHDYDLNADHHMSHSQP